MLVRLPLRRALIVAALLVSLIPVLPSSVHAGDAGPDSAAARVYLPLIAFRSAGSAPAGQQPQQTRRFADEQAEQRDRQLCVPGLRRCLD
jgi:hypothetical protein